MLAQQLSISGCWTFTPRVHTDDRGWFLESFTCQSFSDAVGHQLDVQQTNVSVSSRGTVRGIHFADVPPGQAKFIQCYSGRILDVVVDIRVGSPTFGQWTSIELDAESPQALYIAEGLGHAFCAISDAATVGYMCSTLYAPEREYEIHPMDPQLDIDWPQDIDLRLSPKDAAAPTLAEALSAELLPSFEDCVAHYADLVSQHTS